MRAQTHGRDPTTRPVGDTAVHIAAQASHHPPVTKLDHLCRPSSIQCPSAGMYKRGNRESVCGREWEEDAHACAGTNYQGAIVVYVY